MTLPVCDRIFRKSNKKKKKQKENQRDVQILYITRLFSDTIKY